MFNPEPQPLASPQFPPVTFPATYPRPAVAPVPNQVSSTPQANTCVPAPETRNWFGGWKPVIIPGLIKKFKSWGRGSGCQSCQQRTASSCPHVCPCCGAKRAPVAPSAQATAAPAQSASTAGMPPVAPAAATPPKLVGSPAGYNQVVRDQGLLRPWSGLAGAKASDVTQEGQVIQSAALQGGDKSVQR